MPSPELFDHVRTPRVTARGAVGANLVGGWDGGRYWGPRSSGLKWAPTGAALTWPSLRAFDNNGSPPKKQTPNASVGIAMDDTRAHDIATWGDPWADFEAALAADDDVALDQVFQRAHLTRRWDVLPEWYLLVWNAKLIAVPPLGTVGTGAVGFDTSPAKQGNYNPPRLPPSRTNWPPGAPTFPTSVETVPPWALEAELGPNGVSATEAAELFAAGLFWHVVQPFGGNANLTRAATAEELAALLWTPERSQELFALVGRPVFPGVPQMVALAEEAAALEATTEWQTRAWKWHVAFHEWGGQLGHQNPPPWYGAHVSYRPFWWRVSTADVLAGTVNPFATARVIDPYANGQRWEIFKDKLTFDWGDAAALIIAGGIATILTAGVASAAFGSLALSGGAFAGAAETLVASALGGGVLSEATGGTFSDGFSNAFDPTSAGAALIGGALGDAFGLSPQQIEAATEVAADILNDEIDATTMGNFLGSLNDWLGQANETFGHLEGIAGSVGSIGGTFGGPSGGGIGGALPNNNAGSGTDPSLNLTQDAPSNSMAPVVILAVAVVAFVVLAK